MVLLGLVGDGERVLIIVGIIFHFPFSISQFSIVNFFGSLSSDSEPQRSQMKNEK